jgi:hypothetical protein
LRPQAPCKLNSWARSSEAITQAIEARTLYDLFDP